MGQPDFSDKRLTEDLAHRLLSRAVELDASRDGSISLEDLRAAAVEAGIDPAAFDQAVLDIQAEAAGSGAALTTGRRRRWGLVSGNVLAAGGFWLTLVGFTSIVRLFGMGWQLHALANVLALALSAVLAHRLNGRLAKAAFIGIGAAQLAILLVQLFFGLQSVRGSTTHWAVFLAGLLAVAGISLSNLIAARSRRATVATPLPQEGPDAGASGTDLDRSHRRLALTLLTQSRTG